HGTSDAAENELSPDAVQTGRGRRQLAQPGAADVVHALEIQHDAMASLVDCSGQRARKVSGRRTAYAAGRDEDDCFLSNVHSVDREIPGDVRSGAQGDSVFTVAVSLPTLPPVPCI